MTELEVHFLLDNCERNMFHTQVEKNKPKLRSDRLGTTKTCRKEKGTQKVMTALPWFRSEPESDPNSFTKKKKLGNSTSMTCLDLFIFEKKRKIHLDDELHFQKQEKEEEMFMVWYKW